MIQYISELWSLLSFFKVSAPTSGDDSLKKDKSDHSSEIYWIIENGQSNNWNKVQDQSKAKTLNESTTVSSKKTSPVTSNGTKKQTKNISPIGKENILECKSEKFKKPIESEQLIESKNTKLLRVNDSPTATRKLILLSDDELSNVLQHPLQSKDVLASSTTDLKNPYLRNMPSVGKILQYTMPEAARAALLNWKLSKIRELGEQGFADLQKSNLNSGYRFHSSIEHYFRTKEIPTASSPVLQLWESVKGVFDTFTAMPEIVEKPLFHPTLKYKGICDCVSEIDNQLTIIEWKRSGSSKQTLDATYDAPLQLCAYLGAINSIPEYQGRIRQGMIVVAYENGKQADVHKINEIMLRKYWRAWLGRLHEFWIRSRDNTLLEPI